MAAARILILLLLLPTAAAAQISSQTYPNVIQPGVPQHSPGVPIEINPRVGPPATIPSGPDIFLPIPTVTPGAERPRKAFDFQPSVSLVEEYTDNFNQAQKGQRSNLRSGVRPAISILFDDGPFTAQAGYDVLGFHDTFTEDYGVHHSLAGRFAWQATPLLRFTLSEAFTRSDDPNRADRLALRQGREEFTSNTASLAADYVVTLFQAGAYYRNAFFESTNEETTAHTMGLTGTRPIGTLNSVAVGYEYLNTETQSRPSTATSSSVFAPTVTTRTRTTTTGHQFTTTFSRDVRKDLSAGVTAAYALREQDQTHAREVDFRRWNAAFFSNYVVPETITLVSNIGVAQLTGGGSDGNLLLTSFSGLTYWFGPAVLSASLERGFSETFGSGQNSGVVETLGATVSLSYRFTPLFTGTIGGSYRENKTTGIGNIQGTTGQSNVEETTLVGSASISYQILRWLVSTLEYAHTQVDSNSNAGSTRSYKENRLRFTLSALFY